MYCETIFQIHLTEFLDWRVKDFESKDPEIMLLNSLFCQKQVLDLSKENKNILLKARWYIYDHLENSVSINEEEIKSNTSKGEAKASPELNLNLVNEPSEKSISMNIWNFNPLEKGEDWLMKFYDSFFTTFTDHTNVIFELLTKQNNPYDLLNEYCIQVLYILY